MRILVADDDPEIRSLLKRALAYEGYSVDLAEDGSQALALALAAPPDLVILDLVMPGLDGMEVARRLRAGGDVPILMLTARSGTGDKVAGLDAGADDYLAKPFVLDELLARVRAHLRRRSADRPPALRFADLELDPSKHMVRRGNRPIDLTAREFELLEVFLRQPRQVVTRQFLYEHVWGYDFGGESNIIDVYMRRLRSKLEAEGEPSLLHTIRGVGFVLDNR